MRFIPFICSFIAFLVVSNLTPWLIRYLRKIKLTVKDLNKKNTPLVPISGGLAVLGGILVGLMTYVFIQTFYYKTSQSALYVFAGLTTIFIITLVGFIDDLLIEKSKRNSYGLKQWQKPLLTLAAAVPLMVVGAGTTTMAIPFLGKLNFGLIYPLILIPIGVVGAANMVNMLAGLNGLETGLGLVYTGMLGIYAYVNESYIGALFALITFTSLLAFYIYNKHPAKILPGDSLTYLLGGSLACIAILGNLEKAAIICSIPFFIEFFLKSKSKFKAQSYGFYKNGKVKSLYKKIYSLTHIFTKTGKYTEKQIVYFLMLIELFFSSLIWII
ncbi:MAG: hypothetical protein KJ674_00535 [Nanoarchaeota archaeon]|nr:hypothetical protein [Nanoarchaeota archaeon]